VSWGGAVVNGGRIGEAIGEDIGDRTHWGWSGGK
jgi:hypothetical protein